MAFGLITFLAAQTILLGVQSRESVQDAAVIARSLIDSPPSIGVMATVFPSDHPTLADQPFSLQEYYASCMNNGSLTLVFLPISRHSRNIRASPGNQASISISSKIPDANQPRVALMGAVSVLADTESVPDSIKACYLARHPDAKQWLPGDPHGAHLSYWTRFDPQASKSIYFVGGFGDEHYIGDIPLALYQNSMSQTDLKAQRIMLDQGIAGRVLLPAL
ncbi:pyridoxamine 5'-phosphate oxidase-domain-containing protein [Mycena floridula]|nr:pyridoxamine 5'-phosphate oxidase-domain-containing protein [Mycena floridula]